MDTTSPQNDAPAPPADAASPPPSARRRALLMLCGVFLGLAAIWGAYWFFVSRWQEYTDDAYVGGHVVQITPQVSGTVKAVLVEDTDAVASGDTLIELDAADSQVALEQAEAALAQAVREVRALYVNNRTLRAQITARQTEVDRLTLDLSRRLAIAKSGAVAEEEIDHTREALKAAQANLIQARAQLAANRALTDRADGSPNVSTVAAHPLVLQAAARFEAAYLDRSRAKIVAPVAGQVVKRAVQVGQKVSAGVPLMAVVPLERLWVDANFKEVQLRKMRLGQPVTLTADLHGQSVRYRGRVAGFAAGTGSAFALLPAQNATGNWIKIVQRVPVKIELEAEDLKAHPLRIGLSMRVTVDLHDHDGVRLTPVATADAALDATPNVLPARHASDEALDAARARIREIIRQHDIHDKTP